MKFLQLHLPRLETHALTVEALTLTLPYPACAICHREVDVLEGREDGAELVLVARCHGDDEAVCIPRSLLAPPARIEMASAFWFMAMKFRRGPTHRVRSERWKTC